LAPYPRPPPSLDAEGREAGDLRPVGGGVEAVGERLALPVGHLAAQALLLLMHGRDAFSVGAARNLAACVGERIASEGSGFYTTVAAHGASPPE
jgi:hypothetical protein